MKRIIKNIIFLSLITPVLTGCLEEVYPGQGLTQEQVRQTDNSVGALNSAIAGQFINMGNGNCAYGYAGICVNRDGMYAEIPVVDNLYDTNQDVGFDRNLGNNMYIATDWWQLYFDIVKKTNLTLGAVPTSGDIPQENLAYIGNALGYRAFAYYDMAFTYEFKKTGFAQLDDAAQSSQIYGLTVPIRTENTTEKEGTTDKRAPFYKIYRFIMTDLNRAEIYLQGYKRSGANEMDQATIFGIKARLWLQLGSRFEKHPEDLQTQVNHESDDELAMYDKLGITTANDCFKKAAEYARLAISQGYYPLDKSEWFNATTGFNTANHAWLLAVQINSNDMTASNWNWKNFVGYMSPENVFGVNNSTYKAIRMIDVRLYKTIEDGDWRKTTWIAPADAGQVSAYTKYCTGYSSDDWAKFPAYTSFKFHPRNGERINYKVGAAVDIPLMRIEEMFLIEAEAKAHYLGLAAGKSALESFLNTYRFSDNSYQCKATTIDEFNNEILRQKRIEFWGEGIVYFDYKRLDKAVIRKYDGSNHTEGYQVNSKEGYVAPRLNVCISYYEMMQNPNIVDNPNPTGVR